MCTALWPRPLAAVDGWAGKAPAISPRRRLAERPSHWSVANARRPNLWHAGRQHGKTGGWHAKTLSVRRARGPIGRCGALGRRQRTGAARLEDPRHLRPGRYAWAVRRLRGPRAECRELELGLRPRSDQEDVSGAGESAGRQELAPAGGLPRYGNRQGARQYCRAYGQHAGRAGTGSRGGGSTTASATNPSAALIGGSCAAADSRDTTGASACCYSGTAAGRSGATGCEAIGVGDRRRQASSTRAKRSVQRAGGPGQSGFAAPQGCLRRPSCRD